MELVHVEIWAQHASKIRTAFSGAVLVGQHVVLIVQNVKSTQIVRDSVVLWISTDLVSVVLRAHIAKQMPIVMDIVDH